MAMYYGDNQDKARKVIVTGIPGPQGPAGPQGQGVPAGGTARQVLAKSANADYQTEWVNQTEGLPAGGTEGQVLTKTADGAEWKNPADSGFVKVHSNSEFDIYKTGNLIEIYTNTAISLGSSIQTIPDSSVPFGNYLEVTKQFTNTIPTEYCPKKTSISHFETETVYTAKNMWVKSANVTTNGLIFGSFATYTSRNTTLSPSIDPNTLIAKYAIQ